jgi:hypothetical protein
MGKRLGQLSFAFGVCALVMTGCIERSENAVLAGSQSDSENQQLGGDDPTGPTGPGACRVAVLVTTPPDENEAAIGGDPCKSLLVGNEDLKLTDGFDVDPEVIAPAGFGAGVAMMAALMVAEDTEDSENQLAEMGKACAADLDLEVISVAQRVGVSPIALRLSDGSTILADYNNGTCTPRNP